MEGDSQRRKTMSSRPSHRGSFRPSQIQNRFPIPRPRIKLDDVVKRGFVVEERPTPLPKIYQIVRQLNASKKHPIQLVFLEEEFRYYVMKQFPIHEGRISSSFHREQNIQDFNHKNVIKVIEVQQRLDDEEKGEEPICFILFKLACFGNFDSIVRSKGFIYEDKLARTYFHQLIEGLEHIHQLGYAHLNLALENIFLDDDYLLKIGGFSKLYSEKLGFRPGVQGVKNFRAPEVRINYDVQPEKGDVFSAAIILFTLRYGMLPYLEDHLVGGYDLFECLIKGEDNYWDAFNGCQNKIMHCDKNFQKLFMWMCNSDVKVRATIQDVKGSKWYNGPIYDYEELKIIMRDKVQVSHVFTKSSKK